MKTLLAFALFFAAATAHAEERTKVSYLNKLSFDGKTLSGSYGIGGGCQTHTPAVDVTLSAKAPNAFPTRVATVTVADVSPSIDFCEAFLTVQVNADVRLLIRAKALASGIPATEIDSIGVVLPPVLSHD
jgi:hypothetical protein